MSRRRPSRWHGFLPVWKASGPTSHDVVDVARRALGERRIGHTGTLDPMAEGLLILCVGRATRLQQYMLGWTKSYRGVIQLGHATTTYDREGEVMEPQGEPPAIDHDLLARLEGEFHGEMDQLPPPYSAKKVGGKKLYELARNGEATPLEAKPVTIHDIEMRDAGEHRIEVDVTAGSGFYVRSLAHDIGLELGCGAHLHHLKRVSIGPYRVEDAIAQKDLKAAEDPQQVIDSPAWIPLNQVVLPFPEIEVNRGAVDRFVNGQELVVMHATGGEFNPADFVVVRGPDGDFIGVGTVQHVLARGRTVNIRPKMVLGGQ